MTNILAALAIQYHEVALHPGTVYHHVGTAHLVITGAITAIALALIYGIQLTQQRQLFAIFPLPALVLVAAGACANLASLFIWARGVPDPFRVADPVYNGASAFFNFNPADLMIIGGIAFGWAIIKVRGTASFDAWLDAR